MSKPVIVITRTRPGADALAVRVAAMGYEPLVEPMLAVYATGDVPPPDAAQYDGVVIASAHALAHMPDVTPLLDKPLYAVGRQAGAVARQAGWKDVHEGGGDVAHLATYLCRRKDITRTTKLLHVCGRELARGTRAAFDRVPAMVTPLVVYETRMATGFSQALRTALAGGRIAAITLHSPRGATAFTRNVQAYENLSAWAGIKLLCLAESVLESLGSTGGFEAYTAASPDEDALLALLRDVNSAGRVQRPE